MSLQNKKIIYIDETSSKDNVGLFCSVCDYILSVPGDFHRAVENNCCEDCWITFVIHQKDRWNSGWRPDKNELERYKQQKRILNYNIKDILGVHNES